jgi:hypothetical protein
MSLCYVTQTSHPPDAAFEYVVCAAKAGVAHDLRISPEQAKYGLYVVARAYHKRRRQSHVFHDAPIPKVPLFLAHAGGACTLDLKFSLPIFRSCVGYFEFRETK